MDMIEEIKKMKNNGINPKNFVMQQLGNTNPIIGQLIKMAGNNNTKGIENFARNLLKERGIDYDTEFNKFMNNLG